VSQADVITRMLHAIDALDWAAVRSSFADEVSTDYASLWGGEPETLPAEELAARWTEFVSGLAATQHQTGPLVVSDGYAETHVVAHHWRPEARGGDTRTVHGHYIARIADGKIAELMLETFYASGHDGLPTIAGQRAARRPKRNATHP
jgi:hypothetical protein